MGKVPIPPHVLVSEPLQKYALALELLIYENVDVAGALQDVHACSLYGESCRVIRLELGSRGAQECERFAVSDRHEENGGMLRPMHLGVQRILGRFLDFSGDEPAEPCECTIVFQEKGGGRVRTNVEFLF